jgi:hypothetical protein
MYNMERLVVNVMRKTKLLGDVRTLYKFTDSTSAIMKPSNREQIVATPSKSRKSKNNAFLLPLTFEQFSPLGLFVKY